MPRLIKQFQDGSVLEYDSGSFDDWCVFLTRPDVKRYAPRDTQYFARFAQLGQTHGVKQIYTDFCSMYEITGKNLTPDGHALIERVTAHYGADALEMQILFTVVYAGMVAEENKAFTRLGKRVKRLGLHQVLCEGMPPHIAANFSRGRPWRELAALCEARGF